MNVSKTLPQLGFFDYIESSKENDIYGYCERYLHITGFGKKFRYIKDKGKTTLIEVNEKSTLYTITNIFKVTSYLLCPLLPLTACGIRSLGRSGRTIKQIKIFRYLSIFLSVLKGKKPEYFRIFDSQVFTGYHLQLEQLIRKRLNDKENFMAELENNTNNQFSQKMLSFIRLIQSELPPSGNLRRNFHENMLSLLRGLIDEKEEAKNRGDRLEQEICDVVDAVCYEMYANTDLLFVISELLEQITQIPSFSRYCDHASILKEFHQTLRNNRKLTKSYSLSENFSDPHYFGSLPFTLFKIGSTQLIYTSRVTVESANGKEISVSKEFKRYLTFLKMNGKTHLYINLMRRLDPSDKLGRNKITDANLSQVIEELEEDPEIGAAIMVASIDKNSDFYMQTKDFATKYEGENNAESFMLDFQTQLFLDVEQSSFKWPKKLDLGKWQAECHAILKSVHQNEFQNQKKLTVDERKVFIDLAVTKMIKALHVQLQPNNSNISCRHSMDRGPTTYTLLYLLEKLESQRNLEHLDIKEILGMLFTPAIFTHNRPIDKDRFNRFLLALQHLKNVTRS